MTQVRQTPLTSTRMNQFGYLVLIFGIVGAALGILALLASLVRVRQVEGR